MPGRAESAGDMAIIRGKVRVFRSYAVITIAIRLRSDCRRIARACFNSTQFDASKKWTSIFRRSRIVVVSQSNRNCWLPVTTEHLGTGHAS